MLEFLLAGLGLTSIIIISPLFYPVKKLFYRMPGVLKHFPDCALCVGFWVGAFLSYFTGNESISQAAFAGFMISGITWLVYEVVRALASRAPQMPHHMMDPRNSMGNGCCGDNDNNSSGEIDFVITKDKSENS